MVPTEPSPPPAEPDLSRDHDLGAVLARQARRAGHLVRRFAGSLRPGGPSPADEAWARAQLLAGERELWRTMSGPDRRHAAGVARRVDAAWPAGAERPVLAAALLHDVGKAQTGVGTFGRVGATVAAIAVGHDPARVAGWAGRHGLRGRWGRYLQHPDLGAAALAAVGSDPLTVAWTAQHHLPRAAWTVPPEVGEVLKAADDD